MYTALGMLECYSRIKPLQVVARSLEARCSSSVGFFASGTYLVLQILMGVKESLKGL